MTGEVCPKTAREWCITEGGDMNGYSQGYSSGVLAERSRKAFSEWLQGYNWDCFVTITFSRKCRFPSEAISKVKPTLQSYLPRCFMGAEEHYLGGWHIHAIGYSGLNEAPILDIWTACRKFGRFRDASLIKSRDDVSDYCTKYISKELADWEAWGIFDKG